MTTAEQDLFHFPPFRNASCPTWEEASDRFVYGAWNVYRVDGGNPNFGSVSAVYTSGKVMPPAMILIQRLLSPDTRNDRLHG